MAFDPSDDDSTPTGVQPGVNYGSLLSLLANANQAAIANSPWTGAVQSINALPIDPAARDPYGQFIHSKKDVLLAAALKGLGGGFAQGLQQQDVARQDAATQALLGKAVSGQPITAADRGSMDPSIFNAVSALPSIFGLQAQAYKAQQKAKVQAAFDIAKAQTSGKQAGLGNMGTLLGGSGVPGPPGSAAVVAPVPVDPAAAQYQRALTLFGRDPDGSLKTATEAIKTANAAADTANQFVKKGLPAAEPFERASNAYSQLTSTLDSATKNDSGKYTLPAAATIPIVKSFLAIASPEAPPRTNSSGGLTEADLQSLPQQFRGEVAKSFNGETPLSQDALQAIASVSKNLLLPVQARYMAQVDAHKSGVLAANPLANPDSITALPAAIVPKAPVVAVVPPAGVPVAADPTTADVSSINPLDQ